jgi:DNA mismatch endonuclease (patch repair protein)
MTDVHSPEIRSNNMRAIKSKNTKPEVLVRSLLHRAGFRFRLNRRDLPGRPDLVLPKYRAAIFVNGCFWHGHDCRHFKLPRSNEDFWSLKIESNRQRDSRTASLLQTKGWRHLTVWECATRGHHPAALIQMISNWLQSVHNVSAIGEIEDGTVTIRNP